MNAIIIAISIVLFTSNVSIAFASNDNDENPFRASKGNRPAINPDFPPDYSCLFDVFQLKCMPGSEQDCPKPQFASGDPENCFAKTFINGEWEWECPDGYHSIDDDETGQCYSNEEGCPDDYVLTTSRDSGDKLDRCADPRDIP